MIIHGWKYKMRTRKQLIFDAIFQSDSPPAYDYDTEKVAQRAVDFTIQNLHEEIDQLSTNYPQYRDALSEFRMVLKRYEC